LISEINTVPHRYSNQYEISILHYQYHTPAECQSDNPGAPSVVNTQGGAKSGREHPARWERTTSLANNLDRPPEASAQ
jgi:hypothetical protein